MRPLTNSLRRRQLVCFVRFLGLDHISLGLHVHLTSPNVEIHLPFCFVRIGWQGLYRFGAGPQRSFGRTYQLYDE